MVTAVAGAAVSEHCVHDWDIESPNGPRAKAHCKRCHGEREFDNSLVDEKRINNSDVFDNRRRRPARQAWSENDVEEAVGRLTRR